MEAVLSPVLKLLGGSIMVKVLLAVVTVVVVYALSKLISYFWKMHRTFRDIPCHPNTHWLWGHAHLVRTGLLYSSRYNDFLGHMPGRQASRLITCIISVVYMYVCTYWVCVRTGKKEW